jgi:hypothetical protein
MILTSKKPQAEILESLNGAGIIFIIGCAGCASRSKTGDEKAALEIKDFLLSNGKKVSGHIILPSACNLQNVEKFLGQNENFKTADTALILACGTGAQAVGEIFDKNIVPALNSDFISTTGGAHKNFCSACGNCVLAFTQGICPKTRCPKKLLNGPCGGFVCGNCEVDKDRKCAWVLIYEKLKKKGKLDDFVKSYISPS